MRRLLRAFFGYGVVFLFFFVFFWGCFISRLVRCLARFPLLPGHAFSHVALLVPHPTLNARHSKGPVRPILFSLSSPVPCPSPGLPRAAQVQSSLSTAFTHINNTHTLVSHSDPRGGPPNISAIHIPTPCLPRPLPRWRLKSLFAILLVGPTTAAITIFRRAATPRLGCFMSCLIATAPPT